MNGLSPSLLRLATPLALAQLGLAIGEIVNRLALGRFSESALAASLPGSMLALVFTGVIVNTVGHATALIAEASGARDEALARRIFRQTLVLAGATLPLFLLAVPIGHLIFASVGHAADVRRAETIYFAFSALGGFLSVVATALGTYAAGCGRTKLPATAAFIGCLVDMIATPVLVLGAHLGIIGAGIAKVLGLAIGLMILLLRQRDDLHKTMCSPLKFLFDRTVAARLLRLGLPFGFSSVVGSGTFTIFVLCLGTCGTETLAIANICFSLNNLFNTVIKGIESAVVIVTGTAKGACDRLGLSRAFRSGVLLSLIGLSAIYGPLLFLSDGIIRLFLDADATDSALLLARSVLFLLFISGLFETAKHTATGILRGIGRTGIVFSVHLILSACLWMPATIILARTTANATHLFILNATYTASHAAVLYVFIRRNKS